MKNEKVKVFDMMIHDLRNVHIGFNFLVEDLEINGLDKCSVEGLKDIQSIKQNLTKISRVLLLLEDERSALIHSTQFL